MANRTDFYLVVEPVDLIPDEFFEEEIDQGASIEEIYLTSYNSKWYDWDEDMLAISEKYPELKFTLDGNGDEVDDVWRAFYKGGKSYYWDIDLARPSFDESKLK